MMVLKHLKKVWKIATGQGNDSTASYMLDYPYFRENYKMITIGLRTCRSNSNSTN